MDELIQQALRGRKPEKIKCLLLDNYKVSSISGLTEDFSNLTILSLINDGLTSLDGLPKLASLHSIDLSYNKLSGGLDQLLECSPQLELISLSGNDISDLATLAPLAKLDELAELELFDCAVTEIDDYRNKIFTLIPQLKWLDRIDMNGETMNVDEDEGGEGGNVIDTGEWGIAYIIPSKALQDKDESEEFIAEQNNNEKPISNEEEKSAVGEYARKRKHSEENGAMEGEPKAKQ